MEKTSKLLLEVGNKLIQEPVEDITTDFMKCIQALKNDKKISKDNSFAKYIIGNLLNMIWTNIATDISLQISDANREKIVRITGKYLVQIANEMRSDPSNFSWMEPCSKFYCDIKTFILSLDLPENNETEICL